LFLLNSPTGFVSPHLLHVFSLTDTAPSQSRCAGTPVDSVRSFMEPIRLYTLHEIARRTGRDIRWLKRRSCANPVAVTQAGGYEIKLYRIEDFNGQGAVGK
jgi:hypothetical protein